MNPPIITCPGCGYHLSPDQRQETCPRCSYPIQPKQEEMLLTNFLQHLQRVQTYGGAHLTIEQLLQHTRQRLTSLHYLTSTIQPRKSVVTTSNASFNMTTGAPQPETQTQSPRTEKIFTFKSFLNNQSTNIVASLGAFLILMGSLSFVITTTDLLLAFIVLLVVHAIFGITGAVTYHWQRLRTVSIIYTALFALQVPLVAFTAYRFLVDQYAHLSSATLIMIAAFYAMVIYGALALYQVR